MADITIGGNPIHTNGEIPAVGEKAKDFSLVGTDMSRVSLADFAGSKLVMNIFPSVDTGVCAESVRRFNEAASSLENTKVLCISRDLPFAQKRFCAAEGLNNVVNLSDFEDGSFGQAYGLQIEEGAFKGLHSRVVLVFDADGTVKHSQQVPEIGQEPDYDSALAAV